MRLLDDGQLEALAPDREWDPPMAPVGRQIVHGLYVDDVAPVLEAAAPRTMDRVLTLADLARRYEPDGQAARVAEVLAASNPILDAIPWMPSSMPQLRQLERAMVSVSLWAGHPEHDGLELSYPGYRRAWVNGGDGSWGIRAGMASNERAICFEPNPGPTRPHVTHMAIHEEGAADDQPLYVLNVQPPLWVPPSVAPTFAAGDLALNL